MCFVCKLPLMCTFYEHTAVRIGFRYCFFNSTPSGTAARVVIILVLFAQLSAFLGDLFMKLLLVHLCRLGYLFFLELLFICRCLNVGSVYKNHTGIYHSVIQRLV